MTAVNFAPALIVTISPQSQGFIVVGTPGTDFLTVGASEAYVITSIRACNVGSGPGSIILTRIISGADPYNYCYQFPILASDYEELLTAPIIANDDASVFNIMLAPGSATCHVFIEMAFIAN